MYSGSSHLTGMPMSSPLQITQCVEASSGWTWTFARHLKHEHRFEAGSHLPYHPAGQGLQLVESSSCS